MQILSSVTPRPGQRPAGCCGVWERPLHGVGVLVGAKASCPAVLSVGPGPQRAPSAISRANLSSELAGYQLSGQERSGLEHAGCSRQCHRGGPSHGPPPNFNPLVILLAGSGSPGGFVGNVKSGSGDVRFGLTSSRGDAPERLGEAGL